MRFLNVMISKSLFMFALMFIICISVQAQNVLITKDGDVKTVFDVEVSGTSVYYKLDTEASSPIQKISKDDVFMIKCPDGSKVDLGNGNPNIPSQTNTLSSEDKVDASEYYQQDVARNNQLINEMHSVEISFTGEKKNKTAGFLLCQIVPSADSQLANKDIEISFDMYEGVWNEKKQEFSNQSISFTGGGWIAAKIRNRTDKTIYVDLGNTFLIRNGVSEAYYRPSSTSSTSGGSQGAGINLGGIAGAFGLGGPVGALASGVTLGGTKDNSTTTVVYSQRVVAIPPMSIQKLSIKPMLLNAENKPKTYLGITLNKPLTRGEMSDYTILTTPLKWNFYISYSFDEALTTSGKLNLQLYVNRIIGQGSRNNPFSDLDNISFPSGVLSFDCVQLLQ